MKLKYKKILKKTFVKFYSNITTLKFLEILLIQSRNTNSVITICVFRQLTDAAYYVDGKVLLLEEKRLGQVKWFEEDISHVFKRLNSRIECITEFSTVFSEGYQTVNYGVGGHFSIHVDAFTDVCNHVFGKRIFMICILV